MSGSRSWGEAPPLTGSERVQIGRYMVARELGRGGMGIVYEASDPAIGRRVAIKVINLQFLTGPGEAQALRERLFREAQSAGALSHPGIVAVHDIGEDREMAFIAMEFVDGPSLQHLQQPGKLEIAQVLDMLRQVAAALDYAHANGVIHRDIKPANILLHRGSQVKLADFGIAKITSAPKYTVTGLVMGTPSYMSPEQIEGRELDGRADQFSLAVVAYELLTGTVPFQGATYASVVHSIIYGARPSARGANPLLPTGFDEVLARGMAPDPKDRFSSCAEFVSALDSPRQTGPRNAPTQTVIAQPVAADPTPVPAVAEAPPTATARAGRKLLPALAALALVMLALAGALVYRFWLNPRIHPEQQAKQLQTAAAVSTAIKPGGDQTQLPPSKEKQDSSKAQAISEPKAALENAAQIEKSREPAKKTPAALGDQPKQVARDAVASVPRPPITETVQVKANQTWTDTGIDLAASDSASITATGIIQVAADARLSHQQPGGFYPNCDRPKNLFGQPRGAVTAPNLSCWALIGRVGPRGPLFEVGMHGTVPAGSAGRLYLGVNDDDYSDNSGFWSATIHVEQR